MNSCTAKNESLPHFEIFNGHGIGNTFVKCPALQNQHLRWLLTETRGEASGLGLAEQFFTSNHCSRSYL